MNIEDRKAIKKLAFDYFKQVSQFQTDEEKSDSNLEALAANFVNDVRRTLKAIRDFE